MFLARWLGRHEASPQRTSDPKPLFLEVLTWTRIDEGGAFPGGCWKNYRAEISEDRQGADPGPVTGWLMGVGLPRKE